MADHPIIFSAPMVLALLAGCKTMTRRLRWAGPKAADGIGMRESLWVRVKPDDRLWVRENLCHGPEWTYAADGRPASSDRLFTMVAWANHQRRDSVPSIHMPRWASRLTLVVTATKIEPVQKISEDDARAEGAEPARAGQWGDGEPIKRYRTGFVHLWSKLHGVESWMSNPEIVALTFAVHQRNIDEMKEAA